MEGIAMMVNLDFCMHVCVLCVWGGDVGIIGRQIWGKVCIHIY